MYTVTLTNDKPFITFKTFIEENIHLSQAKQVYILSVSNMCFDIPLYNQVFSLYLVAPFVPMTASTSTMNWCSERYPSMHQVYFFKCQTYMIWISEIIMLWFACRHQRWNTSQVDNVTSLDGDNVVYKCSQIHIQVISTMSLQILLTELRFIFLQNQSAKKYMSTTFVFFFSWSIQWQLSVANAESFQTNLQFRSAQIEFTWILSVWYRSLVIACIHAYLSVLVTDFCHGKRQTGWINF